MRCPHHPTQDVVGYCVVCATFGCDECLTEHEGDLYCQKHYKPIADELERQHKLEERRHQRERQRLVVHTKKHKVHYGFCLALNPKVNQFNLELVDDDGAPLNETRQFTWDELKAVFYVKSFDGKNIEAVNPNQGIGQQGKAIVLEFEDGEIMAGHTLRANAHEEPRFHLIPDEPDSNNLSVLVERSALVGIWEFDEYRHKHQKELREYFKERDKPDYPREELIGDFHFERDDFDRAIRHYRQAANEEGHNQRLAKKLSTAEYNIAARQIKAHKYERAMHYLKLAMRDDPTNARAEKKAKQLQVHIKRKQAKYEQGGKM